MCTFAATALLLCAILAAPTRATACSCIPPPPPCGAVSDYALVFTGRAVDVREDDGLLHTTFEVARAVRGVTGERVSIVTSPNSGSCGIRFTLGASYVVYASLESGEYQTGLCTRTAPVESAAGDAPEGFVARWSSSSVSVAAATCEEANVTFLPILRDAPRSRLPSATARISGLVCYDDGELVPHASVQAIVDENEPYVFETTADERGAFTIESYPHGHLSLRATASLDWSA